MVPINFKPTVRIKTFTPALNWIFSTLLRISEYAFGLPDELLVTSIFDGKHVQNSRHYRGEAIDLRSKSFKSEDKERFRDLLERALNRHPTSPDRFRVLLEGRGTTNEHYHIQVKKGKVFP